MAFAAMTCPNCTREIAQFAAECVCGYRVPGDSSEARIPTYATLPSPLCPRRTLGVTVSAWTGISGGMVSLLLLLAISGDSPNRLPGISLWVGIAVYGGLGLAGILIGVGLLRLREWARIFTLIFSCLLFYCGVLMIAIALFALPPLPEVSEGLLPSLAVLAFVMQAAGVLWLFYFLKGSVRAQFVPGGKIYQRPGSVTAIAIISLLMSAMGLHGLLGSASVATILGNTITGWPGRTILGLEIALGFYTGWGLWRLDERARKLALVLNAVTIANYAPYFFPGGSERIQQLLDAIQVPAAPGNPADDIPSAFMKFFIAQTIVISIFSIGFLHSRRNAFPPTSPMRNP